MTKQTLGMMISSLRKQHGMTQAELADKMYVTDKAVSKWERDLACPDVKSLPKLAEIFNVSVDQLMQVKESGQDDLNKGQVKKLSGLVLKAVALAMGIAVTVLSLLKEIDVYSAFTMLGIGLACVGISLIQDNTHARNE